MPNQDSTLLRHLLKRKASSTDTAYIPPAPPYNPAIRYWDPARYRCYRVKRVRPYPSVPYPVCRHNIQKLLDGIDTSTKATAAKSAARMFGGSELRMRNFLQAADRKNIESLADHQDEADRFGINLLVKLHLDGSNKRLIKLITENGSWFPRGDKCSYCKMPEKLLSKRAIRHDKHNLIKEKPSIENFFRKLNAINMDSKHLAAATACTYFGGCYSDYLVFIEDLPGMNERCLAHTEDQSEKVNIDVFLDMGHGNVSVFVKLWLERGWYSAYCDPANMLFTICHYAANEKGIFDKKDETPFAGHKCIHLKWKELSDVCLVTDLQKGCKVASELFGGDEKAYMNYASRKLPATTKYKSIDQHDEEADENGIDVLVKMHIEMQLCHSHPKVEQLIKNEILNLGDEEAVGPTRQCRICSVNLDTEVHNYQLDIIEIKSRFPEVLKAHWDACWDKNKESNEKRIRRTTNKSLVGNRGSLDSEKSNTSGGEPNKPGSGLNTSASGQKESGSEPKASGSGLNTSWSGLNSSGSEPNASGSEPNASGSDPKASGSGPDKPSSHFTAEDIKRFRHRALIRKGIGHARCHIVPRATRDRFDRMGAAYALDDSDSD